MSQPQLTDVISLDDVLYVVECGCTNNWLSRKDDVVETGRPITIVDLGIDEEKCDECGLHPWIILPLNHPTVVELNSIEDEVVSLFQSIAGDEDEEITVLSR